MKLKDAKPTPEPTDEECFRMLNAVLKSKDRDGKTAVRFMLQAALRRQKKTDMTIIEKVWPDTAEAIKLTISDTAKSAAKHAKEPAGKRK